MKNFKVAQTALEMIASGHSVEIVMVVTGLDPDELLAILDGELGIKPHVVEHVLQVIETDTLGEVELNVNQILCFSCVFTEGAVVGALRFLKRLFTVLLGKQINRHYIQNVKKIRYEKL